MLLLIHGIAMLTGYQPTAQRFAGIQRLFLPTFYQRRTNDIELAKDRDDTAHLAFLRGHHLIIQTMKRSCPLRMDGETGAYASRPFCFVLNVSPSCSGLRPDPPARILTERHRSHLHSLRLKAPAIFSACFATTLCAFCTNPIKAPTYPWYFPPPMQQPTRPQCSYLSVVSKCSQGINPVSYTHLTLPTSDLV